MHVLIVFRYHNRKMWLNFSAYLEEYSFTM